MSNYLFISDAAKEVKVESHVLRYWEEELHLPIKRNELGHRYYTQEDVERFKQIKGMKERGLQLKAIRMILKDGKLDMLPEEDISEEFGVNQEEHNPMGIEIVEARAVDSNLPNQSTGELAPEVKEEKARRLQWLLQEMIRQTILETNQELCREIKESVVKELDYQFRMQEEREEAREQRLAERDEEYYKRMDELLRKKSRRGKLTKKEKEESGKVKPNKKGLELNQQEQNENQTSVEEKGNEEEEGIKKTRERSPLAVEEAIREKTLARKKRHFF